MPKNNKEQEMNPVVHFEMPYIDRNRMADFYARAFGWKTRMLGSEMGNYVTVSTSLMDERTGFPVQPGTINGGFYKRGDDLATQIPSVVIATKNLEETLKMVTEAGGKVIGKPMEIPGVGMYAGFIDTEGNRVSVLEPSKM
jgi:predicted enzyme related to lactoylglutathione lyase